MQVPRAPAFKAADTIDTSIIVDMISTDVCTTWVCIYISLYICTPILYVCIYIYVSVCMYVDVQFVTSSDRALKSKRNESTWAACLPQ